MPLLWELFGVRSWHDGDLDALSAATFDWMLRNAKAVQRARKTRGARRGR
jgi:hypothetical protein